MRITENELVFFHSITKGDGLLGLPVRLRYKHDKEAAIQDTLKGLAKKGYIKDRDQLTFEGVLQAKNIELYKNAKRHVIINYLHIALYDETQCVIIQQLKNGDYEIYNIPRIVIIDRLLHEYAFLGAKSEEHISNEKKAEIDEVLKDIYGGKDNILIGVFEKGVNLDEMMIYKTDQEIISYSMSTKKKKCVQANEARKTLMDVLQIER